MRKNITIYNHKKFADAPGLGATNPQKPAQATNFKDVNYINRILGAKDATKIPGNLVILAIRAVWNDKLPKDNFDKEVYGQISKVNDYIEFLNSLKSVRGIDPKKLTNNLKPALDLITKKMGQNTQQPAGSPMAGAGAGTGVTPSAQAPVFSPNQVAQQPQVSPEQADVYLAYVIPVLEKFSKDATKPKIFTQRYSSEINEITNGLGILRNDAKYFKKLEDYKKRIDDLSILFNKFMYPTGTTQAGNTTFVNDWYTFGNQIINEIQAGLTIESKEKVQKDIGIFQTEFLNKNPGNTDISGVANKVNQAIDKFNIGKVKDNKLTRLR